MHDLFFQRRMKERGEVPEVLQETDLPEALREQFLMVVEGMWFQNEALTAVLEICNERLCRELGVRMLSNEDWPERDVKTFIRTAPTEMAISAIELILQIIPHPNFSGAMLNGAYPRAINEINGRFLWHGVGFQFEQGQIIRADSKFLHSEAVKPALIVLSEPRFAPALGEFLSAYDHYRHGQYEAAIVEACKCFESVMKVICEDRSWPSDKTSTAKSLINILLTKELIPIWMQEHFSGLRQVLESGVPTPRNKLGGHGDGTTHNPVPPHFVSYVLHLTASNIVFLAEADKAKPKTP